jgi:hypothetical protein
VGRNGLAHAGRWAAILLLGVAACSEDKVAEPDGDSTSPFVLGDETAVTLDLPAGARWDAPAAGLRFVFPEGAHGTLRFAAIVDGPAPPWSGGSGFHVAFTGSEPVGLRVPHAAEGLEVLLAYGTPRGSWSEPPSTRWFAMPGAAAAGADSLDLQLAVRSRTGSEACESSLHYWLQRFDPGAPEVDSLNAAIEIAHGFLSAWLDSLDQPLRDACQQRLQGEMAPAFCPEGSYYAGFLRRCGEAPQARPRIGLRAGATRGEIAHQVGHYVTHLLVGDDAYAALEADAGLDPTIGAPRYDRSGAIEDYARYHEHLFTGAVEGAGDPASPATFFAPQGSPPAPEAIDVPSLQGYGVLFLHALGRSDPTMTCLTGETRSVPLVGLRYAALAEHVIAAGAGSMDRLRETTAAYLTSVGRADALPVLLAATGWCYRGSGSILDRSGAHPAGIAVRDVVSAGGRDYAARGAAALTDSLGAYPEIGLFGGASRLRAAVASDSFDTPITINWLKHTPVDVDLGTRIAWPYLDRMERLRINLALGFATATGDTLPFVFNQVLADSNATFTPSRIYLDSPFAYPCVGPAGRSACWVLDSLEIRYDLATGTVEDLRFRLHDLDSRPTRFVLRLRQPLRAVMEGTKRVYFVNQTGVPAEVAQEAFALELTEPSGARHTEADLRGEELWIEVRAYCG